MHAALEKTVWKTAASHWSATTRIAGRALSVAHALPAPLLTAPLSLAQSVIGKNVVPLWSPDLPAGGERRSASALAYADRGDRDSTPQQADAVYVPACVNAMFGPEDDPDPAPVESGAPRLRIIDVVRFVADRIIPVLEPVSRLESVVLHPTCSSTRLGLNEDLRRAADAVAKQVIIPDAWEC
jgi:hypothetical protein